jgi:hypothetical protein
MKHEHSCRERRGGKVVEGDGLLLLGRRKEWREQKSIFALYGTTDPDINGVVDMELSGVRAAAGR